MIEALFFTSVFLLVYTFVGYPVLLMAAARLSPARVPTANPVSGAELSDVEVIVIVHNGAAFIGAKLDNLLALDYPKDKLSIRIVLDGCTDHTADVVRQYNAQNVTLMSFEHQQGKAHGLNAAVAASQAEILLFTDVRQTLAEDALSLLVARLSDPQVAAVSGELVFRQDGINDFGKSMDAYWRYEKFIRERESVIGSVVGVTGAIYAMRREWYQPIPSSTLLDDVLIPMQAVLAGAAVKFESGVYAFDVPSNDHAREKKRKTRTLAGNFQLVQLQPALLSPIKNPLWFQFVSHKMLRLLSPFLLALIFVSNAMLAQQHAFFAVMMALQLGFYALALLAFWSTSARQIRLLSMIHSFLNLMMYTFYGFLAYIRGSYGELWK
ncbi:MAG TPA: family 2 glycosyl transferase [Gammaproteobacteria bacterium]|jgi:cellulose synthase/poly-beta-1,6-N-acetylglucosamine synthase-like glycosyltransferase|nr:family 2 glycosyl transferase [Gammaproteobacteria bacterium]